MSNDHSSTLCVGGVVRRVVEHEFHSIENGFTIEPETGFDGVSDLSNPDWRVRTLAVRDLVRLGRDATPAIVTMLKHGNPHVRQIGAMVLGILRAESASELLGRVLHQDPDQVVRAHAAIALGQIGAPSESLSHGAKADESSDVRHQCAVARDRIQKGQVVEPQMAERFAALEASMFRRVRPGELAPDFALEDTEGCSWRLSDFRGEKTVVLIWIFADWCPVCHNEFHELIEYKTGFVSDGSRLPHSNAMIVTAVG